MILVPAIWGGPNVIEVGIFLYVFSKAILSVDFLPYASVSVIIISTNLSPIEVR
jgi:hypothetical protein